MSQLLVLSDAEANHFDLPPMFNKVQRKKHFVITG